MSYRDGSAAAQILARAGRPEFCMFCGEKVFIIVGRPQPNTTDGVDFPYTLEGESHWLVCRRKIDVAEGGKIMGFQEDMARAAFTHALASRRYRLKRLLANGLVNAYAWLWRGRGEAQ